ncbi:2TM domain-containing protein [Halpernia humi]|uniref:2TM domain-containing protein n=1 Tax=Halpernia humi TaxID=493375 RepID=A0A1H5Y207_9FLAO|nr:2TM domain-containing protein [Halpernia humi]SEG18054.1 2TM domain-containing protein [Halpernia humi]
MENLSQKEIDYSNAKNRVQQLKKFYSSLAIFIVVLAFFSFRKYYLSGEIAFFDTNNFSFIFWIWGLVLAIKAVKIFYLNNDWERRMMDKELKQKENGNF